MPLLSKVKDIFKGGSAAKKKKIYHNVKLDNPEDNWEEVGELGDGAYGKVYKAQHKDTGQFAALKQVVLEGEDDLETFMIEIDVLCECKHPNIVELLEAYHYDGKLWMYLEYCDGGAVDSIMVDLDRPLTEPQIAIICEGLCNALVYIHSNKVIHRDLKAGNVLLTMDGGVKLADFGVSAKNKNTFDKRGTFIGTPYWLAPEVILCETFIDAKYDYKADIWSLGISLIEFAQMDPPNHEVSPVRVMLKIQKSDPPKLDFPSKWSKEFNDFIAKCLTKDPNQRPDAEELLKHPFLSKHFDKKPIIDLLLEYKADVVEEEFDEDNEDSDPCRLSTTSEHFASSPKFEKDSLNSDKHSTIQSNEEDALPSPVLDDREGTSGISSEKKMPKGPAPLPPAVSTSIQPSLKKGPAPAVPSVLPAVNTTAPVTAVTSVTTVTSVTSKTTSVNTEPSSTLVPDASSTVSKAPSALVGITRTSPGDQKDQPSTQIDSSICSPVTHIPEKHSHEELPVLEFEDTMSSISSIPVGKSVYVYKSESYNEEKITVNNTTLSKSKVTDISSQTVIEKEQITSVEMETSASVQSSVSDSHVANAPKVTPSSSANSISERPSQSSSDVLLASISSEGTVIVRTPTPTSLSSTSTKATSNVVTYTVTTEASSNESVSELTPIASVTVATPSTTIPVASSNSQSSVASDASKQVESLSSKLPDSLGEAEAQAVFILETAINSALDSTVINRDSPSDETGPVVMVPSEGTSEHDGSILDVSGHKLDESEVLITSASIPEEEQKQQNQLRANVEPDPRGESLSARVEVPDSDTSTTEEAAHVSVVSVEESKDEVKIVNEPSLAQGSEVIIDGPETTQMSLTIEGTTLEDTDVDEVESEAQSPDSEPPADITQKNETVVPAVISDDKTTTTTSSTPSTPTVGDRDSPTFSPDQPKMFVDGQEETTPLQPILNGIRRQNSRASDDRSDSDTTSTVGSDKENRQLREESDLGEEVTLRHHGKKANSSPVLNSETAARNLKNKELQASIALRKKTRKRTRKFVIDGVVVTTTTSKVIYGDDEEQGVFSSAHLARKQELRELKLVQKREQKQFQDLALKANNAKLEQEKKFELEKATLLRNYDSQIENLVRQQKQLVEKAEAKQENELKIESKKTRADQERELKAFRESLKQEWKLLKQEVDLLPKERRKEVFKLRKEQLERDQAEREKACLERLNDSHEMALKRLNDKHRKHIALKEKQFLEEKHQLLRARESALWDMEERHIQDKHQLAKEQLKDVYFLQRLQMTIRHNVELEQVRRFNQQKEEALLKRQQEERRQLPKRIRHEMKTREKMFREQMRISMTQLPSHEQIKKFQEQEKIKYDKERKRAEMKHKKQMEELQAATEASIKELVHLQNEKGKLLTEHETYKLKSLDEEYQKELKEWKSNLAPRKHKLEEDFERQLKEQEKFYGDYLERSLGLCTPSQSMTSLTSTHH